MAHVLLVDDDSDFIDVNRLVIESQNHRVSVAYSGQECMNFLKTGKPDIIILDCMMEEFNAGFEVANDLSILYPTIPVVMLTSVHDFMSDKWQYKAEEDGKWLPLRRFVEKPLAPEQLLKIIAEELEKLG